MGADRGPAHDRGKGGLAPRPGGTAPHPGGSRREQKGGGLPATKKGEKGDFRHGKNTPTGGEKGERVLPPRAEERRGGAPDDGVAPHRSTRNGRGR